MVGVSIRQFRVFATILVGILILPSAAFAQPKSHKEAYGQWSRMDETLTHSNIGSELSIAPGEAQVLLQQATENQLFSATSGLTEGAPALIEMSPLYAGNGRLSKRAIKKRPTGPVDLTIRLDASQAIVDIGSGEHAFSWPMNAKDSVQAIHGVTHTDLAGESAARVKLVAQATKAATHPVAVIVTQNELLWAQNMLQLTEQTSGTSASGRRGMQNEFAYRTGLLPIDLSQITSAPLDSFAVVLTVETVGRGLFRTNIPFLWLVPVKNGAFDGRRFGYKIAMSLEKENDSGIPGFVRQFSWNPIGLITRVKLEGTTPRHAPPRRSSRSKSKSKSKTQAAAPAPAKTPKLVIPKPVAEAVVPGSKQDPLLKRRRAKSEPFTWGAYGIFGGGMGIDTINYIDAVAMPTIDFGGWFGPGQFMLEITPRHVFASAVYRLGAARDTNYIAVGLTTGSMAKSAVIGPRFHMSRFHRVSGLKMIHDLTLDGLIGKQLMGSIKQSVSARIPLKMGLVLLPGIYTDFNLGMRNDKREPILDVLSGVQVKVAFNGNYKK